MKQLNDGNFNVAGQLNASLRNSSQQINTNLFTITSAPKTINAMSSNIGRQDKQVTMMHSVTRITNVPKTQISQMHLTANRPMEATFGKGSNSISIRPNSTNNFAPKMSMGGNKSHFQTVSIQQSQGTQRQMPAAMMSIASALKTPPKPQNFAGVNGHARYVDSGTTLTGLRYGGSTFTKPRTSVKMNGCVMDEPKSIIIDYNEYKKIQDQKRIPNTGQEPQTSQYLLEDVQFQFLGSRGCLETDRKHTQDEVRLTDISNVVEKGINFGHSLTLREVLEDMNAKRVVFFGEEQGVKEIVQMETVLAMAMLARYQEPKDQKLGPILNIVLEPFAFDQQQLLDNFQSGQLTVEQLFDEYVKVGSSQCYKIRAYRELLEFSQKNSNLIKLHAGFMPQSFVTYLDTQGEEKALQLAQQHNYIPSDVTTLESSDLHYKMFESSMSQRSMYDKDSAPSDQYMNKFKQSLFQDYAMTYQLNKILQNARSGSKFLVIASQGHTKHYQGVPGMLLKQNQILKGHTATILAQKSSDDFALGLPPNDYKEVLMSQFGEAGMNPADYVYLYDQNDMVDEEETLNMKDVIQITGGPNNSIDQQIMMGQTRVDDNIIRTDFTDKDLKIQINYLS